MNTEPVDVLRSDSGTPVVLPRSTADAIRWSARKARLMDLGMRPDEAEAQIRREMPRTLRFGAATVFIDPVQCYVRTSFDDGAHCEARPQYGPEHEARARDLGYATVEAMTLAHDPCHSILATLKGLPYSPTLWNVAHGVTDDESAGMEEDDVLSFQRFLNDPASIAFPPAWRTEALALLVPAITPPTDAGD